MVPLKVTPLVWIFMAIISVLVLLIILIGLILRARCSQSKRQKAKFVRAGSQQATVIKEGRECGGSHPDLIPEMGLTLGCPEGSQGEEKSDTVWLLNRRSVCVANDPMEKHSSFALSPSSHTARHDFKGKREMNGYYCTLPRNLSHSRSNVQISRNLSFEKGTAGGENSEQMCRSEYSQRTLPHPRRRDPDLRSLEPIQFTSPLEAEKCDPCEILPPAPAQFADSSPEEMNKASENVVEVKVDMKMTRF